MDWLPWQQGSELAAVAAAAWTISAHSAHRWARRLRPWAKELTVLLAIYSLWQYAGAWSIGRASAAIGRGQWIWNAERSVGLPSEASAQALILHHPDLIRLLNGYYAWVHVPALGVCLLWLFVRHRDRYPEVRTLAALITGASLIIQLWPVAPPRLLPHTRLVDTAAVFGPSVYSKGAPGIDQLAAMPSLHVGWALVVGGAIVGAGRSRWRWLGLAYPALTTFTVVATGNHYWADGLVMLAIFVPVALVVRRLYSTPRPAFAPARPLPATEERSEVLTA